MTKKSTISGPGAADFLTAQGGLDRPETDPSKGMGQTRDEGRVDAPAELEPQLEAPDPALAREQTISAESREKGTIPPDRGGLRSE